MPVLDAAAVSGLNHRCGGAGQILVKRWSNEGVGVGEKGGGVSKGAVGGQMLVKCWSNTGQSEAPKPVVKCWSNTGQTLVNRGRFGRLCASEEVRMRCQSGVNQA